MKTQEKQNPFDGKTENGNNEPWLTLREAFYELLAMRQGYSK